MACRARALEHATVLFGTVARPFQGLPSTLGAGIVPPEAASASTTRKTVGPLLPRPPYPSTSSPEHVHGRCPWCTAASPILSYPRALSCLGWVPLSPVHLPDILLLPPRALQHLPWPDCRRRPPLRFGQGRASPLLLSSPGKHPGSGDPFPPISLTAGALCPCPSSPGCPPSLASARRASATLPAIPWSP